MSGLEDLGAVREALRDLARVVRATRQTLATVIQDQQQAGRQLSYRPGQLAEALQHLGDVREGFILSQRTSLSISVAELRALVQHVLLDWDWLQALNLAFSPADEIETPQQQLLYFNHALVALAALPRLPAHAITFPQKQPTYADVTAPGLPGELLARIEEIERIIYQTEAMPTKALAYDPLRRTYAFFESSAWLVNNYLDVLLKE
ncbi:MAG: hypothetical protein HYR94_04220 [Chloroflexi bacterium]|nr:hypothetical protein [Chloroflexota bacterium]